MLRSFGLLFAVCTLSVIPATAQFPERQPVESPDEKPARAYRHWTVFLHPSYGYELPVPPGVRAVGEPEAEKEAKFVSPDGSFVMTAWGGLSPRSPKPLMEAQWMLTRSRPGRTITYQRKSESWFVLSGTDEGGTEFYEKFVMHGNHVAVFTLTYPRSRLHDFEPWVEKIEDGFRVVPLPYRRPELAPRLHAGTLDTPDPASVDPDQSPRSGTTRPSDRPQTGTVEEPMTRNQIAIPETTAKREPETRAKSTMVNPAPEKKPGAGTASNMNDLPVGKKVAGKPGFVFSPFDSKQRLIDVVDIPSGTKVKCPYTLKIFQVP